MKTLFSLALSLILTGNALAQCGNGSCGPAMGGIPMAPRSFQQPQLPRSQPQPVHNLQIQHWDAIVKIECNTGRGGSGVLVNDDGQFIILTAEHVVRGAEWCRVIFRDGRYVSGKSIFTDKNRVDVAAVLVDDPGIPPVEIATAAPARGETVWMCGYGSDGRLIGQANQVRGEAGSRLEVYGQVRPGDSGGPVYDARGQVCGINSASSAPGQPGQYNVAACCGPVKSFVNRLRVSLAAGHEYRADRLKAKVAASGCPDGNCLPKRQPDASPPLPRPSQPSQSTNIDARLDAIEAALKGLKGPKGDQGEPGPAGPQGPQGERGAQGPAGKDADLAAVDAKLAKAGIWVEIYDKPGAGATMVDREWVPLGDAVRLYRYDATVK